MGNCVEASAHSLDDVIPRSSGLDMTPVQRAQLPIIFVFGAPGCGRTTQCKLLEKKYNYVHIGTGNLVKTEAQTRTERGYMLARFKSQGKLVPSDVVLDLVKEKMLDAVSLPNIRGFLIDGFPRSKQQGKLFESDIAPVDALVHLNVGDAVLVDRLQGRSITLGVIESYDLTLETIKEYRKHDKAILRYFQNKVIPINGEEEVEQVFADICEKLENFWKIR